VWRKWRNKPFTTHSARNPFRSPSSDSFPQIFLGIQPIVLCYAFYFCEVEIDLRPNFLVVLCVSASSIISLSLTGALPSKSCDVSALWKRHDITCLGWKPCNNEIIKCAVVWPFQASVCRTAHSTVATKPYKTYLRVEVTSNKAVKFTVLRGNVVWFPLTVNDIRGCTDKSLARQGRKQATATKLGIYSTHSPRSSVHFLARCSNFCKPLKKKFWNLSVQPGLRGSNDFHVGRNMATFQLFFSVQGTGGSPTGPDPENRVGGKEIGNQCRPVSSGLQVPGEPGHCRVGTRHIWWPSRSVFPSKCPSILPADISNTPRW